MHVPTKQLPQCVQRVLKNAGYHRIDIKLETSEKISPQYWADAGSRGYFALVNLATGEAKETRGSWGGPNPFVSPVVDSCDKELPIPDGFVAIKGCTGHQCFMTLYGNSATVTPLLPAPSVELSEEEQTVLRAHVELKSSYREEAYRRAGLWGNSTKAVIASLVQKGLLKQNKAGATQVTTDGRNAHRR